jgi:hypothetical protein
LHHYNFRAFSGYRSISLQIDEKRKKLLTSIQNTDLHDGDTDVASFEEYAAPSLSEVTYIELQYYLKKEEFDQKHQAID